MNIFEFCSQVFMAGVVAFAGMVATEPKKKRIENYNALIEKLIEEIKRTNVLAIRYWSSDGRKSGLEAEILSARTECYRLALAVNRKQGPSFEHHFISKEIHQYFVLLTEGSFQQEARTNDMARLNRIDPILKRLCDDVESAKIPFTVRNLALSKVK